MTGHNIWAYYDGRCGLCHRAVVFLLRRDRAGRICFAPTQGERYKQFSAEKRISITPRSILVWDPDKHRLLSEADAVLFLLEAAGQAGLVKLLRLFPAVVLRAAYRFVARLRKLLFREPAGLIPRLPPELTQRVQP